jgi:predicted enzyme related to lactoylglutathione lyase
MHDPVPAVVVFVADVPRLTAFYRELGAMTLTHGDAEHSVLEIEGFHLVVHALAGEVRVGEGGIRVREDSCVKLCIPVASIAGARAIAAAHGGAIKPPEREWEGRGFRACDGHDPEGNVIQVRERAAAE